MSLLLDARALAVRAGHARDPLRALADSLAADVDAVMARPLFIPDEKARLTRVGGRCADDGALLDFDPTSPHRHRCPRCGREYTGEEHYRFWLYWYQLWLAERAVHAAALAAVGHGERYAAFAVTVLEGYAARYLAYPNVDNVLGPTRPFFSTYLESIWLLQLCVATDLLEQRDDRVRVGLGALVRDRIVEPSARLIGSYDEGDSNRQVWNNAALLAANILLDRRASLDPIVFGESGLVQHLTTGLLGDGTWYEGENYHLFAHRGLWYGIVLGQRHGAELPGECLRRFQEGFATPFLTALPDLTLPARRDSQFRISMRQWRFAELAELGLAGVDDPRLAGILARLYGDDVPRHETGRATSSAEAERNTAPTSLTRADLGWRSLLFARPQLPPLTAAQPASVLLDEQGISVLRRDGGVYVALDYGHTGGGHGHPDRLNLLLAHGETRWLDDMGTGSYVDPSLHWYRSTLAHNAPLVEGGSQWRAPGYLYAFDERPEVGWMSAQAAIAPGVVARRSVVVTASYLIDEVEWRAPHAVRFELPLHADLSALDEGISFAVASMDGGTHAEDGFSFITESACAPLATDAIHAFRASDGTTYATARVWIIGDQPMELWRCRAPGAPGDEPRSFVVLRSSAARGRFRIVWDWRKTIRALAARDTMRITLDSGEMQIHSRTDDSWSVETTDPHGRRTAVLEGVVVPDLLADADDTFARPEPEDHRSGRLRPIRSGEAARVLRPGTTVRWSLTEAHYRQSEATWSEAGRPTAAVSLAIDGTAIEIGLQVHHVDRSFVAGGVENPLDNEPADVNGAGVQLFVALDDGRRVGVMLVPERESSSVRIRAIGGWNSRHRGLGVGDASWASTADGYDMTIRLIGALATDGGDVGSHLWLDVIVNEKPAARERRRGQLVLSGGAGEFVYLRGDRHDPDRLIPILLQDG